VDLLELARVEHENLIEAFALIGANVPGALVRRSGGVALVATGLPFLLFNQVIVEDDSVAEAATEAATEAAIAAAVADARTRGDRFVVNLRVGTDDRFLALMGKLGLAPLSERPWMPGMALHPIPHLAYAHEAGHEIRQVADDAGIEDHIVTAAAGFEMPESVLRSVVGRELARHPTVALYVGYTDGEPVSTGLGFRTGRTVGVYNISTLAPFRKRGYGAAMTARIAADAVAAGCDIAILQSSEMGYPVYERMGYRTVVEYMGYVEPAPPVNPPD
jgi:GNAT superfamily N-acetyltransferase